MTLAAKHFGKQLGNFWMNVSTREYMVELAQALFPSLPWKTNEVPHHGHNLELAREALVVAKTLGANRNGGTFAHPRLAVFFARWLDTKFGVWCDAVIHDILTGNAELKITKPEQSAVLQTATTRRKERRSPAPAALTPPPSAIHRHNLRIHHN